MNEIDEYWDARIEEERQLFLTNLLNIQDVDSGKYIKHEEVVEVSLWNGLQFQKVGYGYFRWSEKYRRFLFHVDDYNQYNKEHQFDGFEMKNINSYCFKLINYGNK